ncbi:MAG: VWA domain-containing protein [Betaproteobacteria bacterium]|nr:VWA domain-containing protein [Betaproteobacteria bacterium]
MPGELAGNVLRFARVLRAAGMPVGTDRALRAVAALEVVGVARRDDVHAAMSATMLDSRAQQPVFDAAFDAFWRDPRLLERVLASRLPQAAEPAGAPAPRGNRRVEEAMAAEAGGAGTPSPRDAETVADAALSHSARERLRSTDFEAMSVAEFALAEQLARTLDLPLQPVVSRRYAPAARGRIDLRASLRAMPRQPDAPALAHQRRRRLPPPVVMLIDISGSMERYARAFLQFAHGLARRQRNTHTFVFGTRLTDISRCLRHRDPDEALALAGRAASDWQGGTRIASSLATFNQRWARRVLTRNASLLLVTDGLDRGNAAELDQAAATLARWAREIIWLNPLLRYDRFEPKAAGVRALLPHVSAMIPVHNLHSLADIRQAIERQRGVRSGAGFRPAPPARRWLTPQDPHP